jgi:hypothetical protein
MTTRRRRRQEQQLSLQNSNIVFMMPELCLLIFSYLDNPSLLALYFTFKYAKPIIEKIIKDQRKDDFSGKMLGIRYLKKFMICQCIKYGYQGLVTFFIHIFSKSISFRDICFCNESARLGQLEILKNLRKNRPTAFQWDCFRALLDAASNAHFEVLKWIIEKSGAQARKLLTIKKKSGNIRSFNIKIYDKQHDMAFAAVRGGCIDIMNYLHTEKLAAFDDVNACRIAATNGDLETMQWLREKNCPWDDVVTYKAFTGKHADILRWSVLNGCPFSKRIPRDALTIKWFRDNNILLLLLFESLQELVTYMNVLDHENK